MKKTYYFLVFFLANSINYAQQSHFLQTQADRILSLYFSNHAIQISPFQRVKLRDLFNDLYALTPCKAYAIIDPIITELEKKLVPISHKKDAYANFVINQQVIYLHQYKQKLYETLSWTEKISCSFDTYIEKIKNFVGIGNTIDSHESFHDELVDRILEYSNFERETILFDYHNLLKFFVANKKMPLPALINFWSDRAVHDKLVRRAQSIMAPSIQSFIAEIFMVALQSYLMAGNGMYMQWLDEKDEKIYTKDLQRQNDLETQFEVYTNHVDAVQRNVVTQIIARFKTGLETIFAAQKQANDQLSQEQLHLFKSINLSYPKAQALDWPAVPYDQLFAASIMNTPKPHTWYNIYQNGDWEFDATNNSFWQNGLVPFGIPFWKGGFYTIQKPGQTAQQTITDPSQNSIFTEYISNDKSYEILVECTVYNVSYPFFVGILFNRGRWIAADPERVWQYRTVGLYGTQANASDNNSRQIDLCFAQQKITFDDKNEETIISPVEQINSAQKNNSQVYLYSLKQTDVIDLAKNAVTFVFDITTSPDTVTIALSKKGKEQLIQTTLSSLDSAIALFGGIGFIAPGAQAEFKIVKPEKLVYSSAALKEFLENK